MVSNVRFTFNYPVHTYLSQKKIDNRDREKDMSFGGHEITAWKI